MLVADVVQVACACTRVGLERCRVVCFYKGGGFRKLLVVSLLVGFGIPPCWGELSPLSCGAVLVELGCVSLGVRVSIALRFHTEGFKDCAFH